MPASRRSRPGLTPVLVSCLVASCSANRGVQSPSHVASRYVAAFVSNNGVGLIDEQFRVRMISRASSFGLAWSPDGNRLAWNESAPDDSNVVAQVQLTRVTQIARTAAGFHTSALAWLGNDLYLDDDRRGLGVVSASGALRWKAVRGWHAATDPTNAAYVPGASLAGATSEELLAVVDPVEGTSGYGGPELLAAVTKAGTAVGRTLADFTHLPEGEVVNLPIGHVVTMRDGSVVFATGTRADNCEISLELDHLTSHGLRGLPDLSHGKQYTAITSIGTDSSRTRLFVSVVTMGPECSSSARIPVRTYELVHDTWKSIPSTSSTSQIGGSTYHATLGPPALEPDNGNFAAGPVGTLRITDDRDHRVAVQGIWEFLWAGAD
jgi:hypothetical protein